MKGAIDERSAQHRHYYSRRGRYARVESNAEATPTPLPSTWKRFFLGINPVDTAKTNIMSATEGPALEPSGRFAFILPYIVISIIAYIIGDPAGRGG